MPHSAGTHLVMLSGGLDSATLLYDLLAAGHKPVAMTRASKKAEVQAARTIAEITGVPHVILDSQQQTIGILNAADFERLDPRDHLGADPIPHICSLSDSMLFATLLKIPQVVWGWRRSEMHPLEEPDRHPELLSYISLLSRLRHSPTISAPYFEWSKRKVVERAVTLSVPIAHTYSCLKDLVTPCRTCRRCEERQAALEGLI